MNRICERTGMKILSGIQDDEVRKHIESCSSCASLFQEFAELKMHHAQSRDSVPVPSSELDMKILSAARFLPAARKEKRKTVRQYMYLAASIAVFAIGSCFLLQDSGVPVQKTGVSRLAAPAQKTNEANLLDSMDALNCELFSLTAQLDTDLNYNGYHS